MKRQHPENLNMFWCSKCKGYKDRDKFYKCESNKLGISTYCKKCGREKHQFDYIKHREKRLKQSKEYVALHPDVHRKAYRKYIQKNRDKINSRNAAYAKERYRHNPEKFKAKVKKYASENYEKCKARRKEKYWKNPDIFREKLSKSRNSLDDRYIKDKLKSLDILVIPITIELKRQQITMQRTLKQFKEWRKEHESSYANVHGE